MDYALSMLGPLWQGATVTLKLFFITLALAVPLGLVLALARTSRWAALSAAVNGYIWLMRGTPLMLQMLFIYFALPFVPVIGVRLPDFPAAVLAFALNYAAYFAEIFRAGIQSIDKGQYEAADALGLSYWKKTGLIVLPQALRLVIPPLVNTFIGFFKDTSLVLIIGIFDFLNTANQALVDPNWAGFPGEVYLFAAFVYFIFCYTMSRYSKYLEVELNKGTRR